MRDLNDVSAEDETRSVVEQFYDCLLRADLDGVSRLLHPDVVVHEAPSSPNGGAHTGRTEALKFLALMIFQIIADTVMGGDVLVGASPAAAFLVIPFTHGDPPLLQARLPVVEKFVIRHSLITEITPYCYDAAAVVTSSVGRRQMEPQSVTRMEARTRAGASRNRSNATDLDATRQSLGSP
jgi:hypothetical protein